MAGIATFSTDDSLSDVLRPEWLYTAARLKKNRHAKAFAPDFAAVGALIDDAIKTQNALDDAVVLAAAGRDAADEDLDPVVAQVLATILLITNGDRGDPLYVSYAGDQTAAEVTKPVLGPELALATDWTDSLAKESEPSLQAFAAPLSEVVANGVTAEKEVKAADKALSDFRLLGERKKAVDAFNAARLALFGKVVQFRHDHPELRLPTSWAASFFRRSSRTARFGTTLTQVKAFLKKLDQDQKAAAAFQEELQKKADDYAEAKAQREKAKAELAELRKEQKANKAKERELAAEAKKKLKK